MRVFYSEKHARLMVCLKIDGVEFLAQFKNNSYIPPNINVERALLFHPAYNEMYYDIEEVDEYLAGNIVAVIDNYNGIMNEIKKRFMGVGIENFKKAQIIITWQDIHGTEWIREAQKLKLPVLCVQHGFAAPRVYISFREYRPFYYKIYDRLHKIGVKFDRETNMVGYDASPLLADVFCTWSEADKKTMVAGGIDPKRIEVIGCPVLRKDEKKPRKDNGGINVLFVPHRELPKQQEYESLILFEQLSKMSGINLKIKLKDELQAEHYSGYDIVFSKRSVGVHLERIYDLVNWANVIVEPFFSTLSLIGCHAGVEAINFNWGAAFPVEELPERVMKSLRRGKQYVNNDTRELYEKYSGLSAGNPAENVYNIANKVVSVENKMKFEKRREAFASEL